MANHCYVSVSKSLLQLFYTFRRVALLQFLKKGHSSTSPYQSACLHSYVFHLQLYPAHNHVISVLANFPIVLRVIYTAFTHVLAYSYISFFMLYSIFCHVPIFNASPHPHFTAIPHIVLVVCLLLSPLPLCFHPNLPECSVDSHELSLPTPIFSGSQHLSRVLSHTFPIFCFACTLAGLRSLCSLLLLCNTTCLYASSGSNFAGLIW